LILRSIGMYVLTNQSITPTTTSTSKMLSNDIVIIFYDESYKGETVYVRHCYITFFKTYNIHT
jgi:hypothetical protein